MNKEIEHIVDTIWQNKSIQSNLVEIEGLKKMMTKVVEGMNKLTTIVERLEKG